HHDLVLFPTLRSSDLQLLANAQKHQVGLSIHVAPGLKLPEGFPSVPSQAPLPSEKTQIYLSQDIDYTVHELKDTHKGAIVLDISDRKSTRLNSSHECI